MFVSENLRQMFHSFTPLFLLYKPQILTKQTDLTTRFLIQGRNLCSCVQKIKNKHDSGADVLFYLCVCYSEHGERLTVLLGSKDKNPGNEEA